MRINSVIFKFTDCYKIVDKFKEHDITSLSVGSTKVFALDGQLAIQFFDDLGNPTSGQTAEFQRIISAFKVFGDLFADQKIK